MRTARYTVCMLSLLMACTAPPEILTDPPPDTGHFTETVPQTDTGSPIFAAPPKVVINEVQTDNDATTMNDSMAFVDWIELFNASNEPVDLSRLQISDGAGDRWEGGEGMLEPGAYLLLWADSDLPFGLSVNGERLALLIDGVVVDRIATGEMSADTAWARYPDGQIWAYTARPTPGWSNGSHPGDSTDPTDAIFQTDDILTVDLWITDDQWAALEADNYSYVQASMAFGPAWFSTVGFRKKATVGSNRDLSSKAAFKIDLNRFADHSIAGLEKLTLNSMVQDPTYVAEHLAYSVYRTAGIPAPRIGYVRLFINGDDRGLYALVESVDENFLARWFPSGDGVLYEGAYGTDLVAAEIDDFELDEGETDRSDLAAVAEILAGPAGDAEMLALEQLVDVDSFVVNMAIEAGILHWDGYTTANNYRLYNNPTDGRLVMLPWGTDQTFISSGYAPYTGGGVLMSFCMRNTDCRERYSNALRDVADLMDSLSLHDERMAVRSMLEADIATDPHAEHSAETQDAYLSAMDACIANCPQMLRDAAQ